MRYSTRLLYREQQIIFGTFRYLTPLKFSQLGKIILLFFGLSKDTSKKKINWVKRIKQKKSTKNLI